MKRVPMLACLGVTVVLAITTAAPAVGHGPGASGQGVGVQVIVDAWDALVSRLQKTRDSLKKGSISREAAAKQFSEDADEAKALWNRKSEPRHGRIMPSGGSEASKPLVRGYYPHLARGYAAWMAATLATDPEKRAEYYQMVGDSLDVARGVADQPADASKKVSLPQLNLNDLYAKPVIRQMVIASKLEVSAAGGDREVGDLSPLVGEIRQLRKMTPKDREEMADREYVDSIIGGSSIHDINEAAEGQIAEVLKKSRPQFHEIPVDPVWMAEGRLKTIHGSVTARFPVVVRAVDAAGQPISGAEQTGVTGEYTLRIELPEQPEPTRVTLQLEDALLGEKATYEKPIEIQNMPQPEIAPVGSQRSVTGISVGDLAYQVRRVRAGDHVRVVLRDATGERQLIDQAISEKGDATISVPRFAVLPNATATAFGSVVRGTRTISAEAVALSSTTTPTVAAQVFGADPLVRVLEITVDDYTPPGQELKVRKLTIDGQDMLSLLTPVGSSPGTATEKARVTYLFAGTSFGTSVTVGAGTARDAGDIQVAVPAAPTKWSTADPRGAKLPTGMRELAAGDLTAAAKAYIPLLANAQRGAEAREILKDVLALRLAATGNRKPDLEALRASGIASALGAEYDADLAARIGNATPIVVKTTMAAVSDDGIARVRFEVDGLTGSRAVKDVRLSGTSLEGNGARFITVDRAGNRAIVEFLAVPVRGSSRLGVEVSVGEGTVGAITQPVPVELSRGNIEQGLPSGLAPDLQFARTARWTGAGAPPAWLLAGLRDRRDRVVAAAQVAAGNVGGAPGAVAKALAAITEAEAFAATLKAVTNVEEGAGLAGLRDGIAKALAPKVVDASYSAVKKGDGYVFPDGAQLIVRTRAEKVQLQLAGGGAVSGKAGAEGEWVFDLAGKPAPDGALEVTATVSDIPGAPLTATGSVRASLPAAQIAFGFDEAKKPYVWTDEGDGTKSFSLVYGEDGNGKNEPVEIQFRSTARMMGWKVVDGASAEVGGAGQAPGPAPASSKLLIPAGALKVGRYQVQVSLWETADTSRPPVVEKIPVRIAGRGVAFLVGINYYVQLGRLRHAVDDARALRKTLIARGYAPQNIVYVYGETDPTDKDVPILLTNGLTSVTVSTGGAAGGVSTATTYTMEETRRRGAPRGLATKLVIGNAFKTALEVARARKAKHVLIFFAGHGGQFPIKIGDKPINFNKLLCSDHKPPADPADTKANETTFLATDWTDDVVTNISTPELTVIGLYDACRNGGGGKFGGELKYAPPADRKDVRSVILASCRPNEESNENADADPSTAVEYSGNRFANGFFTFSVVTAAGAVTDTPTVGSLITSASPILAKLVEMANQKVKPGTPEAERPYSKGQSLPPLDDISDKEKAAPVFYAAVGAARTGLISLMRMIAHR